MTEQAPRVSFGVPVRNGAETVGRCLESILCQDYGDFEIIVSDNASTDATCQRIEELMARDARIRLIRQPENVGLIENFNQLARAARGDFFRWVGADDWLEPDYASSCVAALDAQPQAIVATSGFELVERGGGAISRAWEGEFLESPSPRRRLARMLGFFHAGLGLYEPNYALVRREALLASGLLPIHRHCDWLFAVKLGLAGPFVHVPKLLFHRGWSYPDRVSLSGLAGRLHPTPRASLEPSILNLYLGLADVVSRASLTLEDKLICQLIVLRFCAAELRMRIVGAFREYRRSLGINRDLFTRSSGGPRSH